MREKTQNRHATIYMRDMQHNLSAYAPRARAMMTHDAHGALLSTRHARARRLKHAAAQRARACARARNENVARAGARAWCAVLLLTHMMPLFIHVLSVAMSMPFLPMSMPNQPVLSEEGYCSPFHSLLFACFVWEWMAICSTHHRLPGTRLLFITCPSHHTLHAHACFWAIEPMPAERFCHCLPVTPCHSCHDCLLERMPPPLSVYHIYILYLYIESLQRCRRAQKRENEPAHLHSRE